MARTFLIPMVGPADGKGIQANKWRPKYVRELGLDLRSRGNMRFVMLCDVEGKRLDDLAAQSDVIEVHDHMTQEAIDSMAAIMGKAGIPLPNEVTPESVERIVLIKKTGETREERESIKQQMLFERVGIIRAP